MKGSLSRLSRREKTMLLGLGAALFLSAVMVGWAVLRSRISEAEEEVEALRDKITRLETLAPGFVETRRKHEEVQKRIEDNPISSLRIPLNDIAKRVTEEETLDGETKAQKMSDLISFEGKTNETPVGRRNKKKGKKDDNSGVYEVEQGFEFRDVPLKAIFQFFAEVERSPDLIFTTKLELIRKYNEFERARVIATAATYKWVEMAE